MEETLTVIRLGIRGKLRRTLESMNACESMIEIVRRHSEGEPCRVSDEDVHVEAIVNTVSAKQ